jgi:hypothetical protein
MPTIRTLTRLAWVVALCTCVHAQDARTISVRLRDGKTGMPITPSNFLLRADHHDTIQNEWVKINDDGTTVLTVPAGVKEISLQATYEEGMDTYINCDVAKQSDRERVLWYSVEAIMKTGVVTPNECSKTDYPVHPGEFVFFVRKRNAFDRVHNTEAQ